MSQDFLTLTPEQLNFIANGESMSIDLTGKEYIRLNIKMNLVTGIFDSISHEILDKSGCVVLTPDEREKLFEAVDALPKEVLTEIDTQP